MNPALEAAIESARARVVPWDAERSARLTREIARRRGPKRGPTKVARLAADSLEESRGIVITLSGAALFATASVALFTSVIHVSRFIRGSAPEREHTASVSAAEPEGAVRGAAHR